VLVLTRGEVLDVRSLVTVAEITTSIRGLAAEVDIDHAAAGLDRRSVINCDGIHTIAQASLSGPVGRVGDDTMRRVCSAVSYALGC
jgi:mRNA interferase MazF